MRGVTRGLLLALVVSVGWTQDARAATWIVTKTADTFDGICDADCSLREAVVSANFNPGADEIVVPAGFFLLDRANPGGVDEDLGFFGDLDITDDTALTGAGRSSTIIDGHLDLNVIEVNRRPGALWPVVEIAAVSVQHGSTVAVGRGVFADQASLTIRDSAISGNNTGIFSPGSLTVVNSTISGNGTHGISGCPWLVTVINSTISGNGSHAIVLCGGFDGWEGSVLTATNSTISTNGGAGIDLEECWSDGSTERCQVYLTHSTITGNQALGLPYGDAVVTVASTIVAGNSPTNCPDLPFPFPAIQSLGYNLDDDGTCGFTAPGDLSNVADMRLGPLEDHGGPTLAHAPLLSSPLIDAIPAADCTWDDDGDPLTPEVPLFEDQRGAQRPLVGNGSFPADCDIGAVEVTQCADGIDNDGRLGTDWNGSPPDPDCTGPLDNREAATYTCGIGPEVAVVLPVLLVWRARRRRLAA